VTTHQKLEDGSQMNNACSEIGRGLGGTPCVFCSWEWFLTRLGELKIACIRHLRAVQLHLHIHIQACRLSS